MESSHEKKKSCRIKDSIQDIFQLYNNLLGERRVDSTKGKHTAAAKKSNKNQYWDIIVLTTFDETQKLCFEHQIDKKRKCGELPEVAVYVIADPPGHKLGVGGSTLYVLSELRKELTNSLYEKKILIIHSGGSSQRLPSYSAVGKIFSPIPAEGLMVGSKVPQMFDLKLALYLPFCRLLKPGVFVSCADDIETYHLDVTDLDRQLLQESDVVALAHPSSLVIGEGHGVYVVKDVKDSTLSCVHECTEVLQKPSQSDMREAGAVWIESNENSDVERVWSDSVFWLGWDICSDLLHWFDSHHPISSELDAYAHFLPCLGSNKAKAKPSDFSDFRSNMLPIFQGRKFSVILLPDSEFYHLGTMEEYLAHFNVMKNFSHELGIQKNTSNIDNPCLLKDEQENFQPEVTNAGTFIQTHFSHQNLKVTVPDEFIQFVIEKCVIDLPINLTGSVIVSGCSIQKCSSVSLLSNTVTIFANLLYHTLPIIHQGKSIYVTVAFDLNAKMKAASDTLSGLNNYGRKLSEVVQILDLKLVMEHGQKLTLWNARMFTGADSAEESFWLTHHDINKVVCETEGTPLQTDVGNCRKTGLFSMKDVVEQKDLKKLVC
ncbi:hypothetical protein Pcinc_010432 [Petrolisthes cinctipes]|uniref:GDP-fucose pyrophosphorylase domain-containing protein n=1 Tax=Petrolisthes cinctipes TaxID=88211 RepID=A0AAE1KVD0_PETCI|nr:hypothetical protein Pcinc_010432 [Petrolisthes cinctipes]